MVYYGIKMFHMDFTYATYVHKCNICDTCNNIISCLHFSKIVTTRCPWSVQPGATTCWDDRGSTKTKPMKSMGYHIFQTFIHSTYLEYVL